VRGVSLACVEEAGKGMCLGKMCIIVPGQTRQAGGGDGGISTFSYMRALKDERWLLA